MKPNWYAIIVGCVEEGARAAVQLATDHEEDATRLQARIYEEIMVRLNEVIVWDITASYNDREGA